MTDITFEPNDERALAFIDTEDIIKHLEDLGYQVIDKSEHGDVLKGVIKATQELKSILNELEFTSHIPSNGVGNLIQDIQKAIILLKG